MNKQHYITTIIPMVLIMVLFISVAEAASNVSFFFSYSDNDYAPYQANFGRGSYEYDNFLAPYGHWIRVQPVGIVWVPYVYTSWRPYYYGYWIYTNYGPTWVSYEPWGWLTHHYGRWFFAAGNGWCWMPGHEWGPAWVNWATYDNYVSWAPMAPSNYQYDDDYYYNNDGNYYNQDRGGNYGGYRQNSSRQSRWVTVNSADFTRQNITNYVIADRNIPKIKGAGNHAPDIRNIERITGAKISLTEMQKQSFTISGKQVEYYNPAGQLPKIAEESHRINSVLRPATAGVGSEASRKFVIEQDHIVRDTVPASQQRNQTGYPAEKQINPQYHPVSPAPGAGNQNSGRENQTGQQRNQTGYPVEKQVNPQYHPISPVPGAGNQNSGNENHNTGIYYRSNPLPQNQRKMENNPQPAGNPVIIHADAPRKYETDKVNDSHKNAGTPAVEKTTGQSGKNTNTPQQNQQKSKSLTSPQDKNNSSPGGSGHKF
jgi:Family of unknown function (DUF6600)